MILNSLVKLWLFIFIYYYRCESCLFSENVRVNLVAAVSIVIEIDTLMHVTLNLDRRWLTHARIHLYSLHNDIINTYIRFARSFCVDVDKL